LSILAEGLARRFGERTAVEGLTFEARAGEVFGLLGPNGAGKTTTVRMLAGLLTPSEGRAQVAGLDVRKGGEELRRRIGLLTEQPGLYDRLSALDNLRFFVKLNALDEAPALAKAQRWLDRFGLKGREREPVGGFSKGMRQKLALVRTLVHDPSVVFLDEPTSGLDPESARTVREAIAELAQSGKTVVLCSHNLAEVERLCRTVAVVKNRLVGITEVANLRRGQGALKVRLDGEAARFVAALPFPARASGAQLEIEVASDDDCARALELLVRAGARVFEARRDAASLEEAYFALLKEAA
jgi:ABC-2 type transport system ATP-binding protein